MHSTTKVFVLRIKPHEDLKKSILQFAKVKAIKAGIILTCVGSLEQSYLRYANENVAEKKKGHFEILSLTGTFSDSSSHLHLALADRTGATFGGHLLEDNLVFTTAEVAIAELIDLTFERSVDPTYGYQELLVKSRTER